MCSIHTQRVIIATDHFKGLDTTSVEIKRVSEF